MSTPKIEFFWDAVSPYTYIASTQMEKLAADTGVDVVWRPFLLGGAMKETGNRPPGLVPAKGKYMFTDLRRVTKKLGLDFWWPKSFPVNTVNVQRMALALDAAGKHAAFAQAIMAAHFGKGEDISNDEVIDAVLTAIGEDPANVREQCSQASIKQQLKDNTSELVKRGGFGAPTFFYGDEMFWGVDRLEMLTELVIASKNDSK